jgi:hypothetical protein
MSAIVLDRGALALHHVLQVIDVDAAGLLQCAPGGCGHDDVALDPLAQLLLGLGARESVRGARGALGGDLAFDARAAGPPRAVPAHLPSRVGSLEETPAAVGAPTGHRVPYAYRQRSRRSSLLRVLREPAFEHRTRKPDVPAHAQARHPAGTYRFVDPTRLDRQELSSLVWTQKRPIDEHGRLGNQRPGRRILPHYGY